VPVSTEEVPVGSGLSVKVIRRKVNDNNTKDPEKFSDS